MGVVSSPHPACVHSMNQNPGPLNSRTNAGPRAGPGPKLLVELEPAPQVFWRNLSDLVTARRTLPVATTCRPGALWRRGHHHERVPGVDAAREIRTASEFPAYLDHLLSACADLSGAREQSGAGSGAGEGTGRFCATSPDPGGSEPPPGAGRAPDTQE